MHKYFLTQIYQTFLNHNGQVTIINGYEVHIKKKFAFHFAENLFVLTFCNKVQKFQGRVHRIRRNCQIKINLQIIFQRSLPIIKF
jgi:hypothetical protein